ncbi:MAG: RHS repeat-associated core domain-containing protein, partial [Pontiella sp.]
RWLSKDPIGIRGGLNQYVFCGNNPVNFIDPLGLQQGDGWKNSSALTWYLRDYEQGNKNALAQIGSIYAEGGYGIDRDLEKAESWLKKLVNETYKSGRNSANHYGIGKLKLSYHSVLDKKGLHIDYFPTLAYNESLARKDDLAGTEFAVWLYAAHKSSG